MHYDPSNWYWVVSDSKTQVWSSAGFDYVDLSDAAYQAWQRAGNQPTRILDEAELAEVLTQYGIDTTALTTRTKSGLIAYAAAVRYAKETGGVTVNSVQVATDRESQAKITGAYLKASRDATFTTDWKGSGGTFTTLDATAIIALGDAVLAHVAACFSEEKMISEEIDAGTITTKDQVDSAFATVS